MKNTYLPSPYRHYFIPQTATPYMAQQGLATADISPVVPTKTTSTPTVPTYENCKTNKALQNHQARLQAKLPNLANQWANLRPPNPVNLAKVQAPTPVPMLVPMLTALPHQQALPKKPIGR